MNYLFSTALEEFIRDYFLINDFSVEKANKFFETFGPGIKILAMESGGKKVLIPDMPFERFYTYEQLMTSLSHSDKRKFNKIHKGTPYYFMAWFQYFMKNFDAALFFLDAAINEDSRVGKTKWKKYPAGKFLLLQTDDNLAKDTVLEIREILENQFHRISKKFKVNNLEIDNFIDDFVNKISEKRELRTLLSSIYTFFLEYQDHQTKLILRSSLGGTLSPFITHLFKGGIIFETLIKLKYPMAENGTQYNTMGGVFGHSTSFINKYGKIVGIQANSLKEILGIIRESNSAYSSFQITAMIRNTVGHNLIRDDVFKNPNNYIKLVEQEIYAIILFIYEEFLKK